MISVLWMPFVEDVETRQALFQSIMMALSFPVVGLLLVTRRLSLLGDSLSHAMLPGVVLAMVAGCSGGVALFVGGGGSVFVLMAAMLIYSRKGKAFPDSALAYLTVFALAVGVLIAYRYEIDEEILHMLFGDLLDVGGRLLSITAIVGALTWFGVLVFFRRFILALVDPAYFAMTCSIPVVGWIALLALFSAHLTLGFAALGSLMTVGLLIVPTMVGLRWARDPLSVLFVAASFGMVVSYVGLIISHFTSVPAGPTIVTLACVGLFLSYFKKTINAVE